MNRPTGVTIIALLEFSIATLLILIAAASALGVSVLGAVLARTGDLTPGSALLAGAGMIVTIVVLVPAVFIGGLGYGVWHLREWGRIGTVVLAVLGAIGASAGCLWSLFHFRIAGLMVSSIRLSIDLLVLWYLSQPHVARSFQPAG